MKLCRFPAARLALLGAIGLALATSTSRAIAATTVVLARHAEKVTIQETPDPPLTEAGLARAAALARVLADVPLDAAYATHYRRTRDTAKPAATVHGLAVQERDARDVAGTAAEILREHDGDTVLIVGHSNTVPAMIRALGVDTDLTLNEAEDYDDLFVVRIDDDGRATLLHLHYGAPSG
ncbi:MAG: phosphoglycerate mutase family protein [Phycisphaerales bacterium]